MILDIILVALIIVCANIGYKRGAVRSVCNVFSWIISVVVAFLTYNPIAQFITDSPVGQFIQSELAKSMSTSETDFSAIPEIFRKPFEAGVTEATNTMTANLASVIICIISVILTVILVKLLIKLVFKILNVFAKLPVIKQFNKILGLVFGVVSGCFWTCIIVLALTYISIIPGAEFLHEIMDSSTVVALVANNSFLMGFFPDSK